MMGPLKPLGLIIGLAGCLAVGVCIHFLLMTGNCGGDAPACPSDVVPFMLVLPAGIIAAVIGVFLGGGGVVFSGLFVAIGLGALSTLLPLQSGGKPAFGDDPWFAILFGGIFTVSGLFTGALPLLLGGFARRKADEAAWLIANGKQGVGRITDVRDTGITINDNPRVRLTMRVEPTDGSPAVTLQKDVTVSRVAIPQVGQTYPVWFDPAKPSRWAFGTDIQANAPASVHALFARAAPKLHPAMTTKPAAATRWTADADPDPFDEIARLATLRDSGAITDEEFETTKARLLRRIGA